MSLPSRSASASASLSFSTAVPPPSPSLSSMEVEEQRQDAAGQRQLGKRPRERSWSGDWHSLLPQSLDATNVGAQSQHQGEQELGAKLDCSPHIVMLPGPELEQPDSSTPPSAPHSVEVTPTGLPTDSPNDEDQYFNYLVDKFVGAAVHVCSSTLPDDETDYEVEIQQQSVLCAKSALKHYNNDEKNEIKYELISVSMCNDMLIREGCFSHLNFTAKAKEPNPKEELFFAELRWNHGTPDPICVVCFKEIEKVGGLCDTNYLETLSVDEQHCYACDDRLQHPKNGELYNIGHVTMSQYYGF